MNKIKKGPTYADKLLTIKGDWFSNKEWVDNRKEIEEELFSTSSH